MQRRILLVVAGLLLVAALLAIGILVVGRFGDTERRIVGTTVLLALYGLVALPGVVLFARGPAHELATAAVVLAAGSAALTIASIWAWPDSDAVGRAVGTATVAALAAAQTCALLLRRSDGDPPPVRRLFPASCGTAALVAAAFTALVWSDPHSDAWPRLLGALVVLDLLLVALQPVLARALVSGRGTARTRT